MMQMHREAMYHREACMLILKPEHMELVVRLS